MVLVAAGGRLEQLDRPPVRVAEQVHQPAELLVAGDLHEDPAVAQVVEAPRPDAAVALPHREGAGVGVARHRGGEHAGHRRLLGDVDALPVAASPALEQRPEDGDHRPAGGVHARQLAAVAQGLRVRAGQGGGVDREEPRGGECGQVVRAVRAGSGADPAERRHVDHDQAGVVALEPFELGLRDQLVPVPGRPQHDVRARRQRRGPVRAVPHRPLAGVEVRERRAALRVRHPAGERAERAQGVARRLLDHDDLGPEVGQQPPRVSESERVTRFENPHPGQRALHIRRT